MSTRQLLSGLNGEPILRPNERGVRATADLDFAFVPAPRNSPRLAPAPHAPPSPEGRDPRIGDLQFVNERLIERRPPSEVAGASFASAGVHPAPVAVWRAGVARLREHRRDRRRREHRTALVEETELRQFDGDLAQ
jgi:hypothetical protein